MRQTNLALRLATDIQALEARPLNNLSRTLLNRIQGGTVALQVLHDEFKDDLASLYVAIQQLWQLRGIELLNRTPQPDISISPSVEGDPLNLFHNVQAETWKLSRFAYVHRGPKGDLYIETPRSCIRVSILQATALKALFELANPIAPDDLSKRLDWLPNESAADDLLSLLHAAGIADPCDAQGNGPEDLRPELRQWDFHDLLFHNRSRQGRHDGAMGADFRFKGEIDHEPVVKKPRAGISKFVLPRPSEADVALRDPSLTAAMELRRSVRAHHPTFPISSSQLGEFLFRSARNRYHFQTELGEFASRPYPSGGASYELELYLTVDRCRDLDRGFYYYDPETHSVSLFQMPNPDMEALLYNAWVSSAGMCHPQILITIASRFHRVNWKYSGMAYATQLKNTGVLFQTFYLVATAMNLAPCGLGLGDTARFSRLTGNNYFEEGSIGEFMLGTPA